MSKVSVIIAAYNVEKYIEDTVSSVISQTLKDIEIIVVDDCSTDRTLELVQKYAELDTRIKIVRHDVNRSAMLARKTGIEHATGSYIMFLDGDDMLTPDACKAAYQAITEENVDILQFDTELLVEDDHTDFTKRQADFCGYLQSIEYKTISVSPCGLLDSDKVKGIINFTLWNKIYRRDPLCQANEQVPNEYLNIAEDVLLVYLTQYFSKSYSYISKKLYCYRYGSGVTNLSKINDSKITALGKSVFTYTFLRKWTEERKGLRGCKKALMRIKKQMLGNIANTFFHMVEKRQKNQFIHDVLQYCSVEDVILALSDYVYTGANATLEALAQECAILELFSAKKQRAKTIGVYYYRFHNGGVENVLSVLTDVWVKSGYQVVLFTDEEPNKDDYYLNPLVKRIVLPAVRDKEFETQEKRISAFRKAILEHDIDIMVYNAWINPHILLDEMIIKSCGSKLIVHTHGLFCYDISNPDSFIAYHNSALGYLYALADSVIALNDVDMAWWQTFGKRTFKTRNPIKMNLDVEPAKLQGNRILFVGRISPEKQIFDVLKILQLVREQVPDAVLSIVGKGDDPSYTKEVERYIKDNDLGTSVVLEGFTTNVLPYYQMSDIMLCTSKFEGFSLALTESKMCGLPLVAYYLPNWDMARDPKGMINVPQGDVVGAANAIVKILKNEDLKKSMGKEARKSAEELYSIDLAKHWDDIFEQTLQPQEKSDGVSRLSPLETAVNIAVDRYTQGIYDRNLNADVYVPGGDQSARYYEAQCRVLSKALKEISESESYRFGLFMTAIPRKIHNWWKRRKS